MLIQMSMAKKMEPMLTWILREKENVLSLKLLQDRYALITMQATALLITFEGLLASLFPYKMLLR